MIIGFVLLVIGILLLAVGLGLLMAKGDHEGWGPDGPPKSVREERRMDEMLRKRGL